MKKIRYGVLSTAKIGIQKVIPAMQQGLLSEVTAISSRSLENARQAARQCGIEKYYGSYEALLADTDIDAVYNPLPNHLHCPWSIKAMEAGKHVLCEKPLGLNSSEIEALIRTRDRNSVKAAEAFMIKSSPQWQAVRSKVRSGELGELRMIQGFFSYHNIDPENIRNIAEVGGGAMWDIGCYPVTVCRYLFAEEPRRVAALLEFDPVMQTDRLGSVIMEFGSGQAHFGVSTQLVPYQRVNILGSKGRLEVVIPFNAPNDRPCVIRQDSGTLVDEEIISYSFETMDQYTLQADDFSRAILEDGAVKSTLEDGLKNTRVIRAIFAAARENCWITL